MNYPPPQPPYQPPQPPGPPIAPGSEPVVICMGRALVAFDQSSGVVHWHYVAEAAIQRIFRVGARVLAACGESVVCVDLATGRHVGTVAIGFTPDAGLVCGSDLVLADGTTAGSEEPRVVCISSDGAIRWRATTATETPGAWGNAGANRAAEAVLRTYDASNTKRSEIRYARTGYRAGILYSNTVAQPDRN